ncbi:MAG: hypothetical protein D6687_06925 [Acidobacteria bacterium]|jgi:hypothetical protein|nr:MAG: hypothetical protein D6687_06925 [Acidobacteriota bacterium]GIU81348.1 MAG: hypothetical protein KatS3mg006_0412 [Pyrinomonadaceae bacterium]
MKHITEILDEKPFAELTAEELQTIKAHCKACLSCENAFRAALISFELLQAKRMEQAMPSPFFHTRVLAAINRERTKVSQVFTLWWRASAPIIALLLLFVISLLGLTIMLPSSEDEFSTSEIISTEMAITDKRQASELTNDEVFRAIYGNERRK